ncbi:hypothetical protein F2P81_012979 [Scophthalmus maximus]|uniref:Uncharacterized protein n=1 Tax=Scophthalmus maximus TaxID=52904 RepID=A0A6A4SVY6_SCOMX|nr:hypothetical protein F2P81_012979 [Scophthalmus maximus]
MRIGRMHRAKETDDDEVIRKRLLIDGDGAGDDRRINVLLKSFTKWCNSSGTPEEGFTQRMLGTLAQCEFSMGKTLMVYDMNLREMENYEKIYTNIEQNITSAHEKITECKKEIQRAKRIRKNRQEYDALAKVIQQHPDRHETLKQLEALDKELQQLSHIKENVDAKLELRKKQFHVLLSTIQELQQTLENDEKSDNDDNSQECPVENGFHQGVHCENALYMQERYNQTDMNNKGMQVIEKTSN